MSSQPSSIYDENSVFNRLLQEKKPKHRQSSVRTFEGIFSDCAAPSQVISVHDFLPQYET